MCYLVRYRQLYQEGYSPICPVLFQSDFLDDGDAKEQKYDYDCSIVCGRTVSTAEIPSCSWKGAWNYKRRGSGNDNTVGFLLWMAEGIFIMQKVVEDRC